MSPRNHPIKTTLALVLALGAMTPGATAAGPVQDLRAQAKTSSLAGTPARPRQVVTGSAASGLDWGDATIGAAGVLGLSMVAAGGSLAIARKRRHAIAREHT
jgi:hypothetical protein